MTAAEGTEPRSGHRRRTRSLLVALGLVGGAVLVPGAAGAQGTQYSALAAADGVRIQFQVPNFLLVEDFIDAGGPTAQASINTLGRSQGFASAPYPGQTVVTGPGTFAIATGIQLPGGYPFYTATSHPATPSGNVNQPGLVLESKSDQDTSAAVARFGNEEGSGRFESSASVARQGDGTVTAVAETVNDVVRAGPIVIAGLASKASITRGPSGSSETSSSLEAANFTIAETPVQITPEGIVLAGTPVPAESDPALADALAQAGVTVDTVAPRQTEEGVVAPGLRISMTQQIPGAGVPGTITFTLGRALATAVEGPIPAIGVDEETSGGQEARPGGGKGGGLPAAAPNPAHAHPPAPIPAALDDTHASGPRPSRVRMPWNS